MTRVGGDKYAWYSFYPGITYARGGMAVLTYDQAGEGERSVSRRSGTRKLKGDELMARRLCGLMLTDVMQAVSYLQSRTEIDPQRLGAAGVAMDKLDFTEEREGGTLAIGTDVPGIPREQLSVFTPAEWEQASEQLTFDGWTARARSAAQP